jgi:hypothetical protein
MVAFRVVALGLCIAMASCSTAPRKRAEPAAEVDQVSREDAVAIAKAHTLGVGAKPDDYLYETSQNENEWLVIIRRRVPTGFSGSDIIVIDRVTRGIRIIQGR